ncbi:hypothetical protein AB0O34_27360 [Sphaerisporangium sp. NPDC088356]|uniref:hypothetical protein n=1 Tax=Sphaerisporangium sp. NPDC088356 TaxID=3154871 RepID=UPI00344040C6
MESYRRDTTDEPLRDPETGHVLDPAGTPDDRTDSDRTGEATVYDQAEQDRDKHGLNDNDDLDPAHSAEPISASGDFASSERNDLGGRDDLSEPKPNHLTGTNDLPGPDDLTDRDGVSDPTGLDRRDGLSDDDLDGRDGLSEDLAARDRVSGDLDTDAVRAKHGEQADLIVYPDEADYPTRSDDDSLTAGVPDVEPEPVLATSGGVGDNDVHRSGTGTAGAGTGPIDFQQRWREVQAGFVDDPRDAVERADQLVEEAVTALTSRRQGLVDRWKNSDQGDTEQLRLALRDYRSLLEELVGLSYSTAGHGSFPASPEAR